MHRDGESGVFMFFLSHWLYSWEGCWKDSCIHRDVGCGTSCFDYFIGSISGKRLGDARCAFWCCTSVTFWIEGLSCVLFISGGKARRCGKCILVRGRRSGLDSWIESYGFVGKVSSGMGMLLSMDNCPCELSRAGRSFRNIHSGHLGILQLRALHLSHSDYLSQIQEHCVIVVLSFRCDHLDLVYLPSPYTPVTPKRSQAVAAITPNRPRE